MTCFKPVTGAWYVVCDIAHLKIQKSRAEPVAIGVVARYVVRGKNLKRDIARGPRWHRGCRAVDFSHVPSGPRRVITHTPLSPDKARHVLHCTKVPA